MSLAGRDGQPSGRSTGSSRLAAAEPLTSGLVNRRYARQSVRRPSSVRSASACIPAFCFVGWLLPAFHRPSGAVDAQAGTRAFLNIPTCFPLPAVGPGFSACSPLGRLTSDTVQAWKGSQELTTTAKAGVCEPTAAHTQGLVRPTTLAPLPGAPAACRASLTPEPPTRPQSFWLCTRGRLDSSARFCSGSPLVSQARVGDLI